MRRGAAATQRCGGAAATLQDSGCKVAKSPAVLPDTVWSNAWKLLLRTGKGLPLPRSRQKPAALSTALLRHWPAACGKHSALAACCKQHTSQLACAACCAKATHAVCSSTHQSRSEQPSAVHRGSVLTSKSNSSSALLRSLPRLPFPEARACLSLECWCSPLLACSPSALPQLQRKGHLDRGVQ